jgi:hypothetical protein
MENDQNINQNIVETPLNYNQSGLSSSVTLKQGGPNNFAKNDSK